VLKGGDFSNFLAGNFPIMANGDTALKGALKSSKMLLKGNVSQDFWSSACS
jgi:hypothetical protein